MARPSRLASVRELRDLHDQLYGAFSRYGENIGPQVWGWPSGNGESETYQLETSTGRLLLGLGPEYEGRWWLAVTLVPHVSGPMVPIDFEFNIPRDEKSRTRVGFEFLSGEDRRIRVRHTGLFTVRHRIKRKVFFDYYSQHPGKWRVSGVGNAARLEFFTFDLAEFGRRQYESWADEMFQLALYVRKFKDEQRRLLSG